MTSQGKHILENRTGLDIIDFWVMYLLPFITIHVTDIAWLMSLKPRKSHHFPRKYCRSLTSDTGPISLSFENSGCIEGSTFYQLTYLVLISQSLANIFEIELRSRLFKQTMFKLKPHTHMSDIWTQWFDLWWQINHMMLFRCNCGLEKAQSNASNDFQSVTST